MPFEVGNPGRPEGAVGRFAGTVKESVWNAFMELQKDPNCNLVSWAKNNLRDFYVIASRLIPTEISAKMESVKPLVIRWNDETSETVYIDVGSNRNNPNEETKGSGQDIAK